MGDNATLALTLVLAAAVLHAVWNAMVKGAGERVLVLGLISLGHTVTGLAMIPFFEMPGPDSWPYIGASVLIHWFYYWFLITAYRLGDLSQVYPVARGVAPLLVTAGAFVFAGEVPSLAAIGGITLVSFGIMILVWSNGRSRAGVGALGAAVATGTMIASYSVVDGLGARVSGSPFGYIGWLFFLEGFCVFYIFLREREKITMVPMSVYGVGLAGGLLSSAAYGLAIFAKTIAPLGAISAVRESGVIIAALIGVIWLGERPWRLRVVAATIVAAGILLLAIFA